MLHQRHNDDVDVASACESTVGAAIAAAALLSRRAAEELTDRDRVIRIARLEGASLRELADATGLSRQTIANICARPLPTD